MVTSGVTKVESGIVEVFLLDWCENLHHRKTSTPTCSHPRQGRSVRTYTVNCEEPVSALVGRSGSGKTTLIRLAAALEVPSEGSVRIGDCRVDGLSSGDRLKLRRDTVSVIFQDQAMVPEMTVAENLRLALQVSGRRGDKSLIDERLAEVGLAGYERRFVGTLSGGEEQRAAIARALVLNHPVLLADEPTGSLDAENALLVVEALKNVARRGVAVLVATHDDVVYSRCDALMRIDQGALVAA